MCADMPTVSVPEGYFVAETAHQKAYQDAERRREKGKGEEMKYQEFRRCPKCDGHATTKHKLVVDSDYLLRTCTRCGYTWAEEPLDK